MNVCLGCTSKSCLCGAFQTPPILGTERHIFGFSGPRISAFGVRERQDTKEAKILHSKHIHHWRPPKCPLPHFVQSCLCPVARKKADQQGQNLAFQTSTSQAPKNSFVATFCAKFPAVCKCKSECTKPLVGFVHGCAWSSSLCCCAVTLAAYESKMPGRWKPIKRIGMMNFCCTAAGK